MNTEFIKGVVVPIITVIDQDEKIDEAGMRKQVDYVIDGGLQGILAFGSNGEFYQLEEDEMERGRWSCAGILRHRCHQYEEVHPPREDGGRKRRILCFHPSADVPEANP